MHHAGDADRNDDPEERYETCKSLLALKADPNVYDDNGNKPILHWETGSPYFPSLGAAFRM